MRDIAKHIYVVDFKIGDKESCSQRVLVSLNECSLLSQVKYIKNEYFENALAEIKQLQERLKEAEEVIGFVIHCQQFKLTPDMWEDIGETVDYYQKKYLDKKGDVNG